MSSSTPVISTIIPCYNQAHFLPAVVRTLQEQTFSDWEGIIVNDGSSDDTQTVAEKLAQEEPRLRVIQQENRGLSGARNSGIRTARGTYIHLLDSDDLLHPQAYEWLLAGIGSDRRTLAVMKFAFFENDPTQDLTTVGTEREYEPFILRLIEKNLGTCHAYLSPRDFVIDVGGFDESTRAGEEDLWLRLALHGCNLAVIPHVGAYYRRYVGSMSTDPFKMFHGWIQAQIRAWRWLKFGDDELVRIDPETRKTALDLEERQILGSLAKISLQLICAGRVADGMKLWNITRKTFLTRGWSDRIKLIRELFPLIPYMMAGRTTRLTPSQQQSAAALADLVDYSLRRAPLVPDSFRKT